jgi:hypothetical protein
MSTGCKAFKAMQAAKDDCLTGSPARLALTLLAGWWLDADTQITWVVADAECTCKKSLTTLL